MKIRLAARWRRQQIQSALLGKELFLHLELVGSDGVDGGAEMALEGGHVGYQKDAGGSHTRGGSRIVVVVVGCRTVVVDTTILAAGTASSRSSPRRRQSPLHHVEKGRRPGHLPPSEVAVRRSQDEEYGRIAERIAEGLSAENCGVIFQWVETVVAAVAPAVAPALPGHCRRRFLCQHPIFSRDAMVAAVPPGPLLGLLLPPPFHLLDPDGIVQLHSQGRTLLLDDEMSLAAQAGDDAEALAAGAEGLLEGRGRLVLGPSDQDGAKGGRRHLA